MSPEEGHDFLPELDVGVETRPGRKASTLRRLSLAFAGGLGVMGIAQMTST